MENNIRKKEWKRYFMKLLEGMEEEERDEKKKEERHGNRKERRKEEAAEENRALGRKEIRRAVKNMKKKKPAGIDEISMEAWMFGGEAVSKSLLDIMNQMWKEEKIPEEWRISVIVPIYKKGDQEKAENYRGVSLLCTGYKIYAEILRERLEEKIVKKKLLSESQGGFRKGRGAMDNIFILNHVVQREKRKGEKVYAFFVDLKAAFDNVDRNKLWRILKDKGIEEQLIAK